MPPQATMEEGTNSEPPDDRSKEKPPDISNSNSSAGLRKLVLNILLHVANLGFGILIGLPPTFYAKEAEAKGATPSQVEHFIFTTIISHE